ncbi:MAG: sigma-70 family RNA polymerase sigma factor [Bryobacteraceae bacterium]|nr:sigma-70 family RNA polymerase sigma factor [Bryobacteraceae bacterium]
MDAERQNVTGLILSWKSGDPLALEQITELLYEELRRLARACLRRERPGHTLQATALVNEAYLKMTGLAGLDWKDRAHFLGIAACLMRQILIQHARRKGALKRGGADQQVSGVNLALHSEQSLDVIAVDRALSALSAVDALKARMIEMRYFGGMQTEEIAEATGASVATVGRHLRFAQAWLHRYMSGKEKDSRV